jgi:hypothetical protein
MPALMVVLGSGQLLRGADSGPSNPPSSNAIVASLEYQETSNAVANWGVSITPQSAPFKKEPAAAGGKTIRGKLQFAGGPGNSIGFLWQRDAGKLYLDLSGNGDLTGDPGGVFTAPASTGNYVQEMFTNVHLTFNTASGKSRVLADILLYDYGALQPNQPSCTFGLRSFWQGKVTLEGRDWQAGIVQLGVNAAGTFDNGRLLLRPWEERNRKFNVADGLLATVPFARKLFLDGHAWQLECVARSQNGEASPDLHFTGQTVPLGDLKITGQYISRLVLPGAYLVVLDHPAASVQVPVDSYNQPEIALEQKGAAAYRDLPRSQEGGRFSVDGKAPAVLNAGGPLTNSVTASRQGRDLVLDYTLVGAGGDDYTLATEDRTKPPSFAIYKGDKKIGSGDFEYG